MGTQEEPLKAFLVMDYWKRSYYVMLHFPRQGNDPGMLDLPFFSLTLLPFQPKTFSHLFYGSELK